MRGVLNGALAVALLGGAGALPGQTLARPGWAGSGLTAEAWWKNAVLYRIDDTDLMPSAAQLASLQALGVDAVVLPPEAPGAAADPGQAVDDLLLECSRLHIRVLEPLPVGPGSEANGVLDRARVWLSRGVAGFVVSGLGSGAEEGKLAAALRKLVGQYPGERILVAAGRVPVGANGVLQLQTMALGKAPGKNPNILSRLVGLSTLTPRGLVAVGEEDDEPLSLADGALLLASGQPAMLDAAMLDPEVLGRAFPPPAGVVAPEPPAAKPAPPPPPPPEDVYGPFVPYVPPPKPVKKPKAAEAEGAPNAPPAESSLEGQAVFLQRVIQLRHTNTALRQGEVHGLALQGLETLGWIVFPNGRRWGQGSGQIVVLCNLSGATATLDLTPDLQRLRVKADEVKTLVRSGPAVETEGVSAVVVPAHGVVIGELRLVGQRR